MRSQHHENTRRALRIGAVMLGLLMLGAVAFYDLAVIETTLKKSGGYSDAEFEAMTRSTPWHRAADGVREFLWWPFSGALDVVLDAAHEDPYEGASVYGDDLAMYKVNDAQTTHTLGLSPFFVLADALFWAWIGVAGWDAARSLAREGALKNQSVSPGTGAPPE